nr:MAG TPA: hypothetical protein [Caudoviricetes sp.]
MFRRNLRHRVMLLFRRLYLIYKAGHTPQMMHICFAKL